jgi:hypothetical protein
MRRSPARLLTIGLTVLLLVGAAAFALTGREPDLDVSPRTNKQPLMLLTTLPLMFPEDFSLQGGGSRILSALETRYIVVPISTTNAESLRARKLLLLAHPLAQPAEYLVDLDHWVRKGGKLLLLADPKLDWPSNRPLGDKLRPPPSFADTGLLAHWGLKLTAERTNGLMSTEVGPDLVVFSSPGELHGERADCDFDASGIVARCRVGRGKVTVVADADWLNVELPTMRETRDGHIDLLLRELARLER